MVTIVGGGLAGCEAAYQLARRGIPVCLKEARGSLSGFQDGAHKTDMLGELVCSNSLGSSKKESAPGMLKEELRLLGSLILEAADNCAVPAGGALAVDRKLFSEYIQRKIEAEKGITVIREEVKEFPEGLAVIASGPLTSDSFADYIKEKTGSGHLHFYDAISPILEGDSIDYSKAFWGSRYEAGDEGDYLNCPMSEEEYRIFYKELMAAEKAELKDFEKYFEGCMPVEAMAERGEQTLLFGPMKPVGLKDKDGRQPFCVCQLRKEDRFDSGFNIVGFQTRLKRPEQKRVFGLIPALKNAVYLRYGSVHRNTFINSPVILDNKLRLKDSPNIYFAGQITGVEGYMESTATGLIAGLNIYAEVKGIELPEFSCETGFGALLNYIISADPKNFQPMNINFGILPPLEKHVKSRKERREQMVERGLKALAEWKIKSGIF